MAHVIKIGVSGIELAHGKLNFSDDLYHLSVEDGEDLQLLNGVYHDDGDPTALFVRDLGPGKLVFIPDNQEQFDE